ncbi:MAG: SigB/SigF/SigG family RNA polymerase sigma factor [Actinomycetota bacterium]|nr:SigB/SigF/SigG family RNA polymerase sigma factor [Actinomycetota bacterium]
MTADRDIRVVVVGLKFMDGNRLHALPGAAQALKGRGDPDAGALVVLKPPDGSPPGQLDDQAISALFEMAQAPEARSQLVEHFGSLASYLARRFSGRGEPLEDLIQVAHVGLLNAIDRFDSQRGVRFPTYASATIVGELKRHFRDNGWAVHVPRRRQDMSLRINQVLPELTQKLGRSPRISEVADHLEVGQDDVVEAMKAREAYSASSFDVPVSEGGLAPTETMGEEDPSMGLLEGWASIALAVKELPERERRVLYLRFFAGRTQSEIAAEIGVSQMHVSRILSQTIDRLRTASQGPSFAPHVSSEV